MYLITPQGVGTSPGSRMLSVMSGKTRTVTVEVDLSPIRDATKCSTDIKTQDEFRRRTIVGLSFQHRGKRAVARRLDLDLIGIEA
jgi:hypothetical protein